VETPEAARAGARQVVVVFAAALMVGFVLGRWLV
jgi:hypothetical protein